MKLPNLFPHLASTTLEQFIVDRRYLTIEYTNFILVVVGSLFFCLNQWAGLSQAALADVAIVLVAGMLLFLHKPKNSDKMAIATIVFLNLIGFVIRLLSGDMIQGQTLVFLFLSMLISWEMFGAFETKPLAWAMALSAVSFLLNIALFEVFKVFPINVVPPYQFWGAIVFGAMIILLAYQVLRSEGYMVNVIRFERTQLSQILNTTNYGYMLCNLDGTVIRLNYIARFWFEALTGKEINKVWSIKMELPDLWRKIEKSLLDTSVEEQFQDELVITREGKLNQLRVNTYPLSAVGTEPQVLITLSDLTQELKNQRQLIETNRQLEILLVVSQKINEGASFENIYVAVIDYLLSFYVDKRIAYGTVEPNGLVQIRYSKGNEEMKSLTGLVYDLGESESYYEAIMNGQTLFCSNVLYHEAYAPMAYGFLEYDIASCLDVPIKLGDKTVGQICMDSPTPYEWSYFDIDTLTKVGALLSVARINVHANEEKMKAYDAQQALLKEKDILIGEIHHRVKNNLAVINGLFELQKLDFKTEEAARILTDNQHRLYSMSQIHERMYTATAKSSLDFPQYLIAVIKHVVQAEQKGIPKLELLLQLELPILMEIARAVPFGLAINEYMLQLIKDMRQLSMSNQLIAEKPIKLTVCLSEEEPGSYTLSLSNNVIAHSDEDFKGTSGSYLGYGLVKSLTGQFKGKLTVDDTGDRVAITFKA